MKYLGCYTGVNGANWNPFGDVASWERGVLAFGKAIGAAITGANLFPCWAAEQWDAVQFGRLLANIRRTSFGTNFVPVVGLKMISYNQAPENYTWNDPAGYADVAAGRWDAVWEGIPQQLAANGFRYAQVRLSDEFNGSFMQDFMGWDAAGQAAWKAAFAHAAAAMKAKAVSLGVRVDIVLNPADMCNCPDFWTNPPDLTNVSILGVDTYNGFWGTGDVNDPAVRQAFWAAPQNGFGMDMAIAFAKKHGLAISFPECGSGTSPSGPAHAIANDPVFFPWLRRQVAAIRAAGVPFLGMCIWDVNPGDGAWQFSDGSQPAVLAAVRAGAADFVSDDIDVAKVTMASLAGAQTPPRREALPGPRIRTGAR